MTARILITGDKRIGFTWQLVETGKVLHSGNAETESKAVVAGQNALGEHKQKTRWDWRNRARKVIPGDKFNRLNDH